jgi:Tfp pilus assembly PilM family ATPase
MDGLAQYLSTALRLPTFFASPDRDFDLAPDVARMLDDDARQVLPVSLGLAVGANS